MALSSTTKTDLVFKKIKGRQYTTTAKAWYEEYPGTLTYVHYTELWADEIPYPPPESDTDVVKVYSDLKLTEDTTVADKKSWLACETYGDPSTQLKGFIPPRFGQLYTVRVYEDDGAGGIGDEVPTTHPAEWFFDYENGVLVFQNPPANYGLKMPFHIKVYRYIGKVGVGELMENIDGGSASSVYLPSQVVDGGNASAF